MRHYPRYRWLRLLSRRRCVCGLRWPCPDANPRSLGAPLPDGEQRTFLNRPTWDDPTVLLDQPGRAGKLTPAQAYRSGDGGR
jgi:hypothetical protein